MESIEAINELIYITAAENKCMVGSDAGKG